MRRSEHEKLQQKKEKETYNNVTNSIKTKNQNQEHNVRKEGLEPKNNRY